MLLAMLYGVPERMRAVKSAVVRVGVPPVFSRWTDEGVQAVARFSAAPLVLSGRRDIPGQNISENRSAGCPCGQVIC